MKETSLRAALFSQAILPCAVLAALTALVVAAPAADKRAYVSTSSLLEVTLDGKKVSMSLKSASGGTGAAQVVNEKVGPDRIRHKHIAGIKYEPFFLEVSPSDAMELLPLLLNARRFNGSVVSLDFNRKAQLRQDFTNALIAEVEFPALDGGSKEVFSVKVTIAPESVKNSKGGGETAPGDMKKDKRVVASNFRVTIPGLDSSRVSRVEPFTLALKAAESPVGERRDYEKEPASPEFSNVKLLVAEQSAQPFRDWYEESVVQGKNGQESEKTLRLDVLTPDTKETLLALEAIGVGIVAVRPQAVEGAETVRREEAELYVEGWRIAGPGAAPATLPGGGGPRIPGGLRPLEPRKAAGPGK